MYHHIRGIGLVLLAVWFTLNSSIVEARSLGAAQLIRPYSGKRINGLKWKSRLLKVKLRKIQRRGRKWPHAVIIGKFKKRGWRLTWKGKDIRTNKKGLFRLYIPLKKQKRTLRVIAVGPDGKIQMERDKIKFPSWSAWARAEKKAKMKKKRKRMQEQEQEEEEEQEQEQEQPEPTEPYRGGEKKITITPSLGFDYVSYSETATDSTTNVSFTEFAVRLKLGGKIVLKPHRWDIESDFFYQVAAMGSSTTNSAQFWGYQVNTGYVLNPNSAWRLKAALGMWGTSMVVPNSNFGFENVYGPELFPKLTGDLGNGKKLHFHAKYGLISSSIFSFLSLSNRMLELGTSYEFPMSSNNTMQIYLNYSNIAITLGNIPMNSSIITLGTGFNF